MIIEKYQINVQKVTFIMYHLLGDMCRLDKIRASTQLIVFYPLVILKFQKIVKILLIIITKGKVDFSRRPYNLAHALRMNSITFKLR